jgi:hypothetical protein
MSSSIRFAQGARPITLVAALALVLAAPAFAQVYKWKDAKGVTHYSDAPPAKGATAKGEVKQVEVPPAPPVPAAIVKPASAATTVARAEPVVVDAAVAKAAAEQRAANCKRAQENLTALQQTYAAVGVDKDGDGKNDSVLTAEERTAQTTSMQDAVKANCTAAP